MVLTKVMRSACLAALLSESCVSMQHEADECEAGSETCALHLAQLRAQKVHGHTQPRWQRPMENPTESLKMPEWSSECKSIFLDLGSNIGMNVRKLYEPEKYPEAKLLPVLDKAFGDVNTRRKDSGLCVIGFEPNPEHRARLLDMQHAYKRKGWKVHFYQAAAWRSNGFIGLNMTGQRSMDGDFTDEGAHLSMKSGAYPGTREVMVKTVDLASFIKALPAGSIKLMTMDIEGSEYEVLHRLMQENAMCDSVIKSAVLEAHGWGEITNWGDSSTFQEAHPRSMKGINQRLAQLKDSDWCKPAQVSEVMNLDDETYASDVDDEFGDLSQEAMSKAHDIQTFALHARQNTRQVMHAFRHPAWLQECRNIYIDVGSNTGVNVRKLFEPERYPGAQLRERFSEIFGSDRAAPFKQTGLCALALEPNPEHQAHLRQLQHQYRSKGLHVQVYPFAAWSSDGFMLFNTTGNRLPRPEDTTHVGAHLQQHFPTWPGAQEDFSVKTVDFARFLQSLPPNTVKFVTMDIEGAEYETLAQLLEKNALCQNVVQRMSVEHHEWGQISNWGDESSFENGHPRSFGAIKQRILEASDAKKCEPGKATEMELLEDQSYASDIPDAQ